jgi:RRXRR protein
LSEETLSFWIISMTNRIPTLNPDDSPAMPTKLQRAERWVKEGRAEWVYTDLRIKAIRLLFEPSGRKTQPIVVGFDPGKKYAGTAALSAKCTLFMAHLILPFELVKERMANRQLMRRGRRGRRINRKVPFSQRAHRQCRFDNRRGNKLPPSIRANLQLQLRVAKELCRLFPVSQIVYEYIEARGDKSFSPVMVGQKWMLRQLAQFAHVTPLYGWQTAQIRTQLGLIKQKNQKGDAIPATHAVDGVALAASQFVQYEAFQTNREHGHQWTVQVNITSAPFVVVRRPPISRRQLHLMVPAKGNVRRKYGGTTTRHGVRKGDLVKAEMAGRISIGWVSGDTARQISVSDFDWKRIGQFTASKVQSIRRATGLLVKGPQSVSVHAASSR